MITKSEKFYDELDEFEIPDQPNIDSKPAIPLTSSEVLEIKKDALKKIPKVFKMLTCIEKRSTLTPDAKFKNLYKMVYDPNLLAHSLGSVMKKTGSLSIGVDELNTDSINYKTIMKISEDLKNNIFKFKPIRRIYIDKTGKDPKINKRVIKIYRENQLTKTKIKELKIRPLGILTTKDKIIAESIRLILNSIYEPEFKKLNLNFGFRPGLGCLNAIDTHIDKAKSHTFAIEADITGAFDNVDHDILMKILTKKIDDQRFLKLIKDGLQSGIFFAGTIEQSKIGTTQGSNISPLLYNIYFNEFDNYINSDFRLYLQQINESENRISEPRNYLYAKITKTKSKIKKSFIELSEQLKDLYEKSGIHTKEYKNTLSKLQSTKEEYRKLDKRQKLVHRTSTNRQIIRFQYTRYADDWIFTTNASLEQTKKFKDLFSQWIKKHLKLDLSETKTQITPLNKKHNKIKFLGFCLSYFSSSTPYIRRVGRFRISNKNFKGFKFQHIALENIPKLASTKKIATVNLIPAFDRDRVFNRLAEARFIKKKRNTFYGRSKPEWTILETPDIIERYNQIIRGYLNYYGPLIKYTSELNYLLYLLQYSCLHTLANKYNTKISKIIKKFGNSPSVKWNTKITKKVANQPNQIITVERTTSLINWKTAKQIIKKSALNFKTKTLKKLYTENQIPLDNIPTIKYNWRTKFKLTKHCSICGCTENINYHHVRHIKIGKTTGFLQVMNQLNRKQIPVCKNCHLNIHKGKYDDLKLSDLFDERLIIL